MKIAEGVPESCLERPPRRSGTATVELRLAAHARRGADLRCFDAAWAVDAGFGIDVMRYRPCCDPCRCNRSGRFASANRATDDLTRVLDSRFRESAILAATCHILDALRMARGGSRHKRLASIKTTPLRFSPDVHRIGTHASRFRAADDLDHWGANCPKDRPVVIGGRTVALGSARLWRIDTRKAAACGCSTRAEPRLVCEEIHIELWSLVLLLYFTFDRRRPTRC